MEPQGPMNQGACEQSSQIEEFQFLHFTVPNHAKSAETRRKVRSHAQHRVQQNLRNESGKERGKSKQVVLDSSVLIGFPHPSDLGAGRSDPFRRYPIDMDTRAHELYDHLHGDTCSMFRTMSKLGFFQIVDDDAGFRQILCTSLCHKARLQNKSNPLEAITLSTAAVQSVSSRLMHPVLSTSDGVIISLIAFACHAVMFHDVDWLLAHFNGLEQVISQRMRTRALLNPILRIMIFWLDVNTAFLLCRHPRFPCPSDILPTINAELLPPVSNAELLQICFTEDLISIIKSVYNINWLIKSSFATRNIWDDGLFAGYYIMPLLHKLLSIHSGPCEDVIGLCKEQACSIGVILYLASIRRYFGISLATNVYIPKLKETVAKWQLSYVVEADHPLLWVVMMGGIQSLHHEDHQWFVSTMAALISSYAYDSWHSVMETINKVLWIPGILDIECNKFHEEVSSAFSGHNIPILL